MRLSCSAEDQINKHNFRIECDAAEALLNQSLLRTFSLLLSLLSSRCCCCFCSSPFAPFCSRCPMIYWPRVNYSLPNWTFSFVVWDFGLNVTSTVVSLWRTTLQEMPICCPWTSNSCAILSRAFRAIWLVSCCWFAWTCSSSLWLCATFRVHVCLYLDFSLWHRFDCPLGLVCALCATSSPTRCDCLVRLWPNALLQAFQTTEIVILNTK